MPNHWGNLLAEAQAEINATLASLPHKLHEKAADLPVTYEKRPSRALVKSGLDPDLLGLFVGEAFPDGEAGAVDLPPQILLFLENLWDFAEGDEEVFREEVRTTYLHELGHYLGLDEDGLFERGLE